MYVDVSLSNTSVRIINIHAPNDEKERKLFFEDLYPFLLTKIHIILGGDFNCVTDIKIDKIGGNPNFGTIGNDNIKSICNDFKPFCHLYPNKISTNWFSPNVSYRLDRGEDAEEIEAIWQIHIPFGHSDHDVVFLELEICNNINFGKGYWKFNNSLLQDKTFVRKFTKCWLNLIEGFTIFGKIIPSSAIF